MRAFWAVALGGIAGALFALVSSQEADEVVVVSADKEEDATGGPVPESPDARIPLVIPDAERKRENPVTGSPEVVERGRKLFASQCTMCHGAGGDGKGDLVARLGLTVPDFTDPAARTRRTDGELFYVLSQGHGAMPGQGKRLKDEESWTLIHYIRALARG